VKGFVRRFVRSAAVLTVVQFLAGCENPPEYSPWSRNLIAMVVGITMLSFVFAAAPVVKRIRVR